MRTTSWGWGWGGGRVLLGGRGGWAEEQIARDEGTGEFKGELGRGEEGGGGADVVEEGDEGEGGGGEEGVGRGGELLVEDCCS